MSWDIRWKFQGNGFHVLARNWHMACMNEDSLKSVSDVWFVNWMRAAEWRNQTGRLKTVLAFISKRSSKCLGKMLHRKVLINNKRKGELWSEFGAVSACLQRSRESRWRCRECYENILRRNFLSWKTFSRACHRVDLCFVVCKSLEIECNLMKCSSSSGINQKKKKCFEHFLHSLQFVVHK